MQTYDNWCCEVQVAIIESSMVNERGGIVMLYLVLKYFR